eukprot:352204-Chlamydomonas_euryale.AAC.1
MGVKCSERRLDAAVPKVMACTCTSSGQAEHPSASTSIRRSIHIPSPFPTPRTGTQPATHAPLRAPCAAPPPAGPPPRCLQSCLQQSAKQMLRLAPPPATGAAAPGGPAACM